MKKIVLILSGLFFVNKIFAKNARKNIDNHIFSTPHNYYITIGDLNYPIKEIRVQKNNSQNIDMFFWKTETMKSYLPVMLDSTIGKLSRLIFAEAHEYNKQMPFKCFLAIGQVVKNRINSECFKPPIRNYNDVFNNKQFLGLNSVLFKDSLEKIKNNIGQSKLHFIQAIVAAVNVYFNMSDDIVGNAQFFNQSRIISGIDKRYWNEKYIAQYCKHYFWKCTKKKL